MKYLSFVWANLRRKPMRTVFTFISIVFAFTLLALVFGLDANLRQMAGSARADRIYTSARFAGKLRLAQMDQISRMRDVSEVGALGGIAGYYQRPGNNLAILMLGSGMRKVFPELLPTAQQWQMLTTKRDGVIVSRLLATRYGLKVGGELSVFSPGTPKANGSDAWRFEILGIVPDIPTMPVGFAAGNYDYLDQERSQTDRGEVQQFWVLAKDASRTDVVTSEIDRSLSSSAVLTRSVSEKALLESMGGGGSDAISALKALAILGIFMITYLTANALRHSIRERTTELAVLKTLGFSNARIAGLVITEVALPCLAGCIFGLGIAAAGALVMPSILPTGVVLPLPKIGPEIVSFGIGGALLVALLAAALPVLRIARLDVATALAGH